MSRAVLVAVCSTLLIAFAAVGAVPQKPFLECDRDELVRAVPDLAALQFDSNQDTLDALMQASSENLETMLEKFVDLSAAEDINEIRLEESMAGTSRRETFRYRMRLPPEGSPELISEFRLDAAGKPPLQPATIDFLVTGHFFKLVTYLLPRYRGQWRFRYLGRVQSGKQNSFVVALEQSTPGGPNTGTLQGLAWIDSTAKRIVRLRMDVLTPPEHSPFETLTTDIAVVPVTFQSPDRTLWLPAKVTVHARYAGGEVHSVHRYSDYQADNGNGSGNPDASIPREPDAYEKTARGIQLAQQNDFAGAIPVLREALSADPGIPAAHFTLANALRSTGDMPGAEAELREAVKFAPDSGVIHNFLGIVLSKRGDAAGAVVEFRHSVQSQPKQPIVHFNLAQALEQSGDRAAALQEYRTASELAPDNATFKSRYEQFGKVASSPATAAPETTIKVDVRQVLVPVIVTNKEGHHVTGLTAADFQVFEDGVEQKISGFNVEDAGPPDESAASIPAQPSTASEEKAPPPASKPAQVRRTYVICIDSLHSAFANLVAIRTSLEKLFRSEQPGDAQYIVLAIGTSAQLVQNTTTDPEKVLQALESKDFQKLYLASRKSSANDTLLAFRRRLDQVRDACDHGQPECRSGKAGLPSQASEIASEDRAYTMAFLSQFQYLIQQLTHASDRRTVVLISDGFQLVPGKQAYELMVAYFPELQSYALRTVDRMPDLDPILHLAANRNIPIYTIDSRGLYTQSFFDASNPGGVSRMMPAVLGIMNGNATDAGGTLSEIAAATGGTAFQNSNDLLTGMQRAFADGRQYYVLAYVSANPNQDGKFRSISVRLRDHKMLIKAKRGYWAIAN